MERGKNKTERKRPVLTTAFFLTGILVISLSLMLSNCGKAQQKSIIADGGSFAIDLSLASNQGLVVLVNANSFHPSLNGTPFTVEAWVKSTNNDDGAIFSRFGTGFGTSASGGIALYSATSTARFVLRIPVSGSTGADYIIDSGVNINDGAWHHITALLVDKDHASTHATSTANCLPTRCCTSTVRSEIPHLDIYVDGLFKNCRSTWDLADSATKAQFANSTSGFDKAFLGRMDATLDGITINEHFDGIIDEVRLYKVAKTSDDITATWNRELNNSEIASVDLIGYWRNNVGIGSISPESSGGGYNGTIFQCDDGTIPPDLSCIKWENSWVAGDW